jgi:hypothetical protein
VSKRVFGFKIMLRRVSKLSGMHRDSDGLLTQAERYTGRSLEPAKLPNVHECISSLTQPRTHVCERAVLWINWIFVKLKSFFFFCGIVTCRRKVGTLETAYTEQLSTFTPQRTTTAGNVA